LVVKSGRNDLLGRTICRWKHNRKHISKTYDGLANTGLIWLRIRTSGGPLRKR